MADNPIKKALATADVVQGANRAMEHNSNPRVLILDRTALETSVRRNYGEGEDAYREEYVYSVLSLFDRAEARGDGVAVYENHDLGHPEVGEREYVSYGSTDAQLETRDTIFVGTTGIVHGDDIIPITLPDIGGRVNWRFMLVAIVPPVRGEH